MPSLCHELFRKSWCLGYLEFLPPPSFPFNYDRGSKSSKWRARLSVDWHEQLSYRAHQNVTKVFIVRPSGLSPHILFCCSFFPKKQKESSSAAAIWIWSFPSEKIAKLARWAISSILIYQLSEGAWVCKQALLALFKAVTSFSRFLWSCSYK